MEPVVVTAAIGAISALAVMSLRDGVLVPWQEGKRTRTRRTEQRLVRAYNVLHFQAYRLLRWGPLSTEGKAALVELRRVAQTWGHLLSPAVRANLFAILHESPDEADIVNLTNAIAPEYQALLAKCQQ